MLQVIAIVQALTNILGAFSGSGSGIPAQTLTQIHAALDKATALLAAFQGFKPPNSLQNDLDDLYSLVGLIENTGIVPAADEHFADIQAIIGKFKAVEANLDSGQLALFFKFTRTNATTGQKVVVDVAGFEEGGAFAHDQVGA